MRGILVVALALPWAGCLGWSGPQTADCVEPTPSILLIEFTTDVAVAEYWHVAEDGALLVMYGDPYGEGARVEVPSAWRGPDADRMCRAMAAFERPAPVSDHTPYHRLTVEHAAATTVPDVDALRHHLQAASDPYRQESCMPEGPAWVRITLEGRVHEIDAACSRDPAWNDWTDGLYDIVDRRPWAWLDGD